MCPRPNLSQDIDMLGGKMAKIILLFMIFVSVMLTYKFFNRSGDQEVS